MLRTIIITCSSTLQLCSHPDELHVKLRIFITNFCKLGVRAHSSSTIELYKMQRK